MDRLLFMDLFTNQPFGPAGAAHWGAAGGHFVFAPFFGLFWLLLIGFVIFWVVRRGRVDHSSHSHYASAPTTPTSRPIDILAERYARGEINTEEYRERLEQLRAQQF